MYRYMLKGFEFFIGPDKGKFEPKCEYFSTLIYTCVLCSKTSHRDSSF